MEVMKALYPSEGGSPKAFICLEKNSDKTTCARVTRTQRGMWTHLRRKHKVKKQADFVFETDIPGEIDKFGIPVIHGEHIRAT